MPGEKNVQSSSGSSGENLSDPFAHEVGLMKNIMKGMDKTGRGFEFMRNKFPSVSDAKIKVGIFVGPQITELMQDKQFDEDLNETHGCLLRAFARTS
jgi:hypothetical protein